MTTQSQHTQGQWTAQKIAMSGNYLINVTEPDGNVFTIAQFKASINMSGKRKQEHEANAALIAAAAELLETLERLINSTWLSIDYERNRSPEAIALRSQAVAAIAKAKGK